MLEISIEKALVDRVKELGGLCYKLTGYKGIPDRLVLLPGGKIFFVELKRIKGKCSPAQMLVHAKIRSMKISVFVINSQEKLDKYIPLCGENNELN